MSWTPELYVHAMAVEGEAAQRYAELAGRMVEQHDEAAAALFAELSAAEAQHLEALRARMQGTPLPPLSSDYSWPAVDIESAVQAEKRARAFFEQARRVSCEPGVVALADEMTAEENEHIARIARLMDRS